MPDNRNAARRATVHKRVMLWGLVSILLGSLLLPATGYLYTGLAGSPAVAAQTDTDNPRANYWRAVRQGEDGYTSVPGGKGEGRQVLIQNGGQIWREIRNGPVASIAPWVLGVVLLLIAVYYLIMGKKRIDGTPSGRTVERWSGGERLVHWYTAILFIILAITGLSLLFGRAVLIPLFGLQGFSAYANVAMVVHNFAGPLFLVGVILEVIAWIKYNTFKGYDWEWLKQFGGMMRRGSHPPAGRANAGEKLWFWFIATVGLIGVGISGLILDFPNFGQSRETMQLANVIHATLGILWIAIAFGHIYLGTIGVEGAFRGMATGRVSEEWMQQHHNIWYEEMQSGGRARTERDRPGAARGATSPTSGAS